MRVFVKTNMNQQKFLWMLLILFALQWNVACSKKVIGAKGENQSGNINERCPKQVTDFDGNQYSTVLIDKQCWMAENLRSIHHADGSEVKESWAYKDDKSNVQQYGRLYRWSAVSNPAGICPEGWHVPSDEDYKVLERFLGMMETDIEGTGWRRTNNESRKLKEHDYAYFWSDAEKSEINITGFSALPAGVRMTGGSYTGLGNYVDFWTSTEDDNANAWNRSLVWIALHPGSDEIYRKPIEKEWGFSVRCIKD